MSESSVASVLECTGDLKDICSYEYPQPAWRQFLKVLEIWRISAVINIHSQRGVSSWMYWRSEGYLQLWISTASVASFLEYTGDLKDICSYSVASVLECSGDLKDICSYEYAQSA